MNHGLDHGFFREYRPMRLAIVCWLVYFRVISNGRHYVIYCNPNDHVCRFFHEFIDVIIQNTVLLIRNETIKLILVIQVNPVIMNRLGPRKILCYKQNSLYANRCAIGLYM